VPESAFHLEVTCKYQRTNTQTNSTQAADSKEVRLKRQEAKADELANRGSANGSISAGLSGLVGIGTGVWDGLSGVVLKPIQGAQEGGFEGFFKGVGDGAIGAVTKPAAGVINAGQQAVNVVTNLIQPMQIFARLRIPRAVFGDHILRKYDLIDAQSYWEMYTNEVRLRKEGKIAEAQSEAEKRSSYFDVCVLNSSMLAPEQSDSRQQ
jgi:hypothetical protein